MCIKALNRVSFVKPLVTLHIQRGTCEAPEYFTKSLYRTGSVYTYTKMSVFFPTDMVCLAKPLHRGDFAHRRDFTKPLYRGFCTYRAGFMKP